MDNAAYHSAFMRRVYSTFLPGMFSKDVHKSFNTQVDLVLDFMKKSKGIIEDLTDKYENCYEGIAKADKVSMERVRTSVERLLNSE